MKTTMKKLIHAFFLLSTALLAASSANAAPLYFPHVDTSLPWQTEIAIINTGDQTVTGTLVALSDTGQTVDTKDVTLAAHGRRQITVANEFINSTNIGYIIFNTNSDAVQGYTKFYQAGLYRAAIPAVKEVNSSDINISHIDSSVEWWTGISLVNTTSTSKALTIAFNTGLSVPVTLNANEHKAFTIGDLLNQPIQPDIQSAVITNASGVIGLEVFGNNGGTNHLDGVLLTDKTASTLYYPHVENNGWWTGIVAYNPSVSASTITIAPYSAQGTALTTSTLPLAGKGKYIGLVSGLNLPTQTAWFRIDSTQPLSGFELFSTLDGELLAAYAGGGGIGATTGVFAKIETNGGWTGIAFVNTEVGAASVTLTAYNDNGSVVATQVLPVGGHAKVVNYAQTIFSQDISSATYIAYSSDRNVVGFQLNGSADGTMLDGLPGLGGTPQLSVNTVTPENGATNVPTTATVSITFNEAMNSATINATTFTVSAGGAPVPGAISSSGTTYTFTPAASLAAGTVYTVTVTTGVTNVAGNPMAANFASTFTTAAAVDTTPPVVSTVSPANGVANVPTTSTVSVTFNEAMNSATINATSFTVSAGGTLVAGAISPSGTTYTFTPAANLAAGTVYTVTVTTGVTDVAGNPMAANFTSTFTTAAAGPVTRDVSIVDFAFSPAAITINVGDTVRWTNNGAAPHTTTSGTTPTPDGKWASPALSSGQTFSFTFTQAGVFPYFCAIHTFMTGTITVQ